MLRDDRVRLGDLTLETQLALGFSELERGAHRKPKNDDDNPNAQDGMAKREADHHAEPAR